MGIYNRLIQGYCFKEEYYGMILQIKLQNDDITRLCHGIMLWNYITGIYYGIRLRTYVKELYYETMLQTYITKIYFQLYAGKKLTLPNQKDPGNPRGVLGLPGILEDPWGRHGTP